MMAPRQLPQPDGGTSYAHGRPAPVSPRPGAPGSDTAPLPDTRPMPSNPDRVVEKK